MGKLKNQLQKKHIMGSLFGKIWQRMIGTREMRILMVGLDAAGKTTILYKLKLGEVVNTIPTIGFNVETVEYRNISFNVWDVGGQDKIRLLWRHYYTNTQGLIYVVDSNIASVLRRTVRSSTRCLLRKSSATPSSLSSPTSRISPARSPAPRSLTSSVCTRSVAAPGSSSPPAPCAVTACMRASTGSPSLSPAPA